MPQENLTNLQLNNFAVAFFVPPMFQAWAWGTYIFFAVFLAGGIVWVWFFLPETKGVTMEEMDRVFGSHTAADDARMLAEAQRDVEMSLGQDTATKAVEVKYLDHKNSESTDIV